MHISIFLLSISHLVFNFQSRWPSKFDELAFYIQYIKNTSLEADYNLYNQVYDDVKIGNQTSAANKLLKLYVYYIH